jgi:hypothetical protein
MSRFLKVSIPTVTYTVCSAVSISTVDCADRAIAM